MTPPEGAPRARRAGKAFFIRRARSTRAHPATARQANSAPSTHDAAPIRAVQLGTPVTVEMEMIATPAPTSARDVRIQARAVRSLANENRGPGSSPRPKTLPGLG
jgi:hypothetical protein